jgi:hypothetical protein
MTCPNYTIHPSTKVDLNSSLMTTKSLISLSEFDAWEFPFMYQLSVPKCSSIEEIWNITNLEPFEHLGLSHNELQNLERLMKKLQTEELYEPIFRFVEWCISEAPFAGWDHDAFAEFDILHRYFITNKGKGEKPFFYDGDELNFWNTYFKLRAFEDTLPHFTKSLRNLIQRYTHLIGEFSQETHP